MNHHDALNLGMFLAGLLMALVPISISVGILVWTLKERQRSARERTSTLAPPSEGGTA